MPELFELIDLNGDGKLSKAEIVSAAGLLDMTPEEAARFFDSLDVDCSGTLSKGKFGAASFAKNIAVGVDAEARSLVAFLVRSDPNADASSKSEELASHFKLINPYGDGELTKSEVVDAAGHLGLTEEAASLFNDIGEFGSGAPTRAEFGPTAFAGDLATGLASMSSLLDFSVGGTGIVRPERIPSDDSKKALYFASRGDDSIDLNRIPKISIPKHVQSSRRSLSPVDKRIGTSI
jgi:Ca2+-binding EF-hand superfamily protein